jgi:hypothetical protein
MILTDEHLTDELARFLGWRPFPDRFLTEGRCWISRSRFQPLASIHDAFRLLENVTQDYSIKKSRTEGFSVEVRLSGRVGRAAGEPKARMITLAIARALKLDGVGCEGVLPPKMGGRKSRIGEGQGE